MAPTHSHILHAGRTAALAVGLALIASSALAQAPTRGAVSNANASPSRSARVSALPPFMQEAELVAEDLVDPGERFGQSVSLSGDRALVGASGVVVDGNFSGGAYVFVRDGTTWTREATLEAADGLALDRFGQSVALSGDRAIVGALGDDDNGDFSGSAYVFVRDGDTWTQEAKLTATDGRASDFFGEYVALWGDRALVGARGDDETTANSGSVYVFVRNGTTWTQEAKLNASDPESGRFFGDALALSDDRAIVGSVRDASSGSNSGSAYVFVRDGTTWTQEAKLTAADGAENGIFGESVSLSGDRVLVGAGGSESAYVFRRDGTSWSQEFRIGAVGSSDSRFGDSVSLSGERALIGASFDEGRVPGSGSAYLFVRNGDAWTLETRLFAADGEAGDQYGISAALTQELALVGALRGDGSGTDTGSAYVFSERLPTASEALGQGAATLSAAVPNPANRGAAMRLTLAAPQTVRATLVDALGREVAVLHSGPVSGTTRLDLDTSALAPGLYVVRVQGETFAATRRLTVAR